MTYFIEFVGVPTKSPIDGQGTYEVEYRSRGIRRQPIECCEHSMGLHKGVMATSTQGI